MVRSSGEVVGAAKNAVSTPRGREQFLNQVSAIVSDMIEDYQQQLLANPYFQAFTDGVSIGKSGASGAGDRRVALPLLSDPSYHITVQQGQAASAAIHKLVGAAASGRVAPQQATRLLAGSIAASQIAHTLAGQAPVEGAAPTRLHTVTQKIGALMLGHQLKMLQVIHSQHSHANKWRNTAEQLTARLDAQAETSAVRAYHVSVVAATDRVFAGVHATLNAIIKYVNDQSNNTVLIKRLSGGHPAFQANGSYTELSLDPTLCLSISDIEDMIMLFDADLLAGNRDYQLMIGGLASQVEHAAQFERRSSAEVLAHQEARMEAYLVHTEALQLRRQKQRLSKSS